MFPDHLWAINPAVEIILNDHQNISLSFRAPGTLHFSTFLNLNGDMWQVLSSRMCKEMMEATSKPGSKVSYRIIPTLSLLSLPRWLDAEYPLGNFKKIMETRRILKKLSHNPWRERLITWTWLKSKTPALQQALLKEWKNKPQARRKLLQDTYLIKDFYPNKEPLKNQQ